MVRPPSAAFGGTANNGTVFRLTHNGSGWSFHPLYSFAGGMNGSEPKARVIIGPDSNLYGTTYAGGEGSCSQNPGCGVVFEVSPPATFCRNVLCPWNQTVLYRFPGGASGGIPGSGDLLFDSQGNIYGTTQIGGAFDAGTVYKLTYSNGSWVQTVLYSFTGGFDGANPVGGVIMDAAGNLYGTTYMGGANNSGTIYKLTPAGSNWIETTLPALQSSTDGNATTAGLVFDRAGNLYGAASGQGPNGGGTVFELSPSGGNWIFSVLVAFAPGNGGGGPAASLTMDADGNRCNESEDARRSFLWFV